MATVQTETLTGRITDSSLYSNLDIIDFVKEATWKDLLIELVKKNKLDPWNVDIISLVDNYVSTVKALKVMDLRVPANIILASAVLLRLKSEMLIIIEEEEETMEPIIEGRASRPVVEDLALRLRPAPKRKISLDELITALEEAMKIKETRIAEQFNAKFEIPITINKVDIEADTERIYAEIRSSVDKTNMTTFSYLLKDLDLEDPLLGLFIPLLFLASKSKIALVQEKFFEEIIIALK